MKHDKSTSSRCLHPVCSGVRVSLRSLLPKLPRAKRGPRFCKAIACLKADAQLLGSDNSADSRIMIKDYMDAIAVLERVRSQNAAGLVEANLKP